MIITKADGTQEPFEENKLVSSLRRAGADDSVAGSITQDVTRELYAGITTSEIYRRAFSMLRTHRNSLAARYSVKRAVLELGPSGFPFESFVAELYRAEGFSCEVDQIIQGACVEHEVDVIVRGKGEVVYVEAKFHNAAGFKTDLKTVLYVQARIDDIHAARPKEHMRGMVVTNTKFTDRAEAYAGCKNLALLGWDVPHGDALEDKIQRTGLYPITALTTLSKREKTALLSQRIVLCNTLPGETQGLAAAGIEGRRATAVLEEVGSLCTPSSTLIQ
jgi:hypothetical protein